jgi:flavorubredoxin
MENLMPQVDEVADGIYRIATFVPRFGLTFNQFLVVDEQPLLFHTGHRRLFQETLAGVARLVEPAQIRWVSWSHFEADESGALNAFLKVAPMAEPVHSELGADNVDDFAIRPTHTIKDGEALELGTHRLRFLLTPHVPHAWDSILAYEETTGTLFASDLLAQGGDRPALTEADVVEPAVAVLREYPDVIPLGAHTFRVLDRLEALAPRTLAIHHGATFVGDVRQTLKDFRIELSHRSARADGDEEPLGDLDVAPSVTRPHRTRGR